MPGEIRAVTINDAQRINEIANWYIENSVINFDTTPWSIEKRYEWIENFIDPANPYHLLVYDDIEEGVIGFANNTDFRPKAAYSSSTETTVYIDHDIKSNGRGEMLYHSLLDKVKVEKFHRAYAVIALPNAPSIKLHEKLGFHLVCTFSEVGMKFGKYHDGTIYEKKL